MNVFEDLQECLRLKARNPQVSLRRAYAVRRACKEHCIKQPACQWCGRTDQPQAHHKIPMWKDESLAADPDNFITLCGPKRKCHLDVGHNGNFAGRYVENVQEICDKRAVILRDERAGVGNPGDRIVLSSVEPLMDADEESRIFIAIVAVLYVVKAVAWPLRFVYWLAASRRKEDFPTLTD